MNPQQKPPVAASVRRYRQRRAAQHKSLGWCRNLGNAKDLRKSQFTHQPTKGDFYG